LRRNVQGLGDPVSSSGDGGPAAVEEWGDIADYRGGVTCLIDTQLCRIILYYNLELSFTFNVFTNSGAPLGRRIGLPKPTRDFQPPSSGERARAVESRIDKLSAPVGPPKSGLVPE